jgi:hypothetical protein
VRCAVLSDIIAGMALEDREQLRLLSIFHYAYSGVAALLACVPIAISVIGVLLITHPGQLGAAKNAPPAFVGYLFVALGVVAALMGWAGAICCFLAGRFLARRKHWLFCMIAAGMNCTHVPLGTALGVFTLVVLMRPEVKGMFVSPPSLPPQGAVQQSGL